MRNRALKPMGLLDPSFGSRLLARYGIEVDFFYAGAELVFLQEGGPEEAGPPVQGKEQIVPPAVHKHYTLITRLQFALTILFGSQSKHVSSLRPPIFASVPVLSAATGGFMKTTDPAARQLSSRGAYHGRWHGHSRLMQAGIEPAGEPTQDRAIRFFYPDPVSFGDKGDSQGQGPDHLPVQQNWRPAQSRGSHRTGIRTPSLLLAQVLEQALAQARVQASAQTTQAAQAPAQTFADQFQEGFSPATPIQVSAQIQAFFKKWAQRATFQHVHNHRRLQADLEEAGTPASWLSFPQIDEGAAGLASPIFNQQQQVLVSNSFQWAFKGTGLTQPILRKMIQQLLLIDQMIFNREQQLTSPQLHPGNQRQGTLPKQQLEGSGGANLERGLQWIQEAGFRFAWLQPRLIQGVLGSISAVHSNIAEKWGKADQLDQMSLSLLRGQFNRMGSSLKWIRHLDQTSLLKQINPTDQTDQLNQPNWISPINQSGVFKWSRQADPTILLKWGRLIDRIALLSGYGQAEQAGLLSRKKQLDRTRLVSLKEQIEWINLVNPLNLDNPIHQHGLINQIRQAVRLFMGGKTPRQNRGFFQQNRDFFKQRQAIPRAWASPEAQPAEAAYVQRKAGKEPGTVSNLLELRVLTSEAAFHTKENSGDQSRNIVPYPVARLLTVTSIAMIKEILGRMERVFHRLVTPTGKDWVQKLTWRELPLSGLFGSVNPETGKLLGKPFSLQTPSTGPAFQDPASVLLFRQKNLVQISSIQQIRKIGSGKDTSWIPLTAGISPAPVLIKRGVIQLAFGTGEDKRSWKAAGTVDHSSIKMVGGPVVSNQGSIVSGKTGQAETGVSSPISLLPQRSLKEERKGQSKKGESKAVFPQGNRLTGSALLLTSSAKYLSHLQSKEAISRANDILASGKTKGLDVPGPSIQEPTARPAELVWKPEPQPPAASRASEAAEEAGSPQQDILFQTEEQPPQYELLNEQMTVSLPPAANEPGADINKIADQVYKRLEDRLRVERQRRGLFR